VRAIQLIYGQDVIDDLAFCEKHNAVIMRYDHALMTMGPSPPVWLSALTLRQSLRSRVTGGGLNEYHSPAADGGESDRQPARLRSPCWPDEARNEMYEDRFCDWQRWGSRNEVDGLAFPGVYAIAICSDDIAGSRFSWRPEIVYIGMTNAAAGLKGRLQQFDNTIAGKRGHGGADRVRYKHRGYKALCKRLYVAVAPFACDVTSNTPRDLRVMGRVARFEYECFAHFSTVFRRLPEFNDKQKAPKYSLTVGRQSPARLSARQQWPAG
jgi:hypothetical protein